MVVSKSSSFSCGSGGCDTQRQTRGWNAGVSSHRRLRPGRRRSHKQKRSCPSVSKSSTPKSQVFFFGLLIALSLLCSPAEGTKTYGDRQRSAIDRLVQRGELLVDRNPPPIPPRMHLERRQDDAVSSSATALPSSLLPSTAATPSGSTSDPVSDAPPTIPTIISADPPSAQNLPQPFDTSLGNNFTSPACPSFIRSFRDNSTFLSCLPLSLLLQVSPMLPN